MSAQEPVREQLHILDETVEDHQHGTDERIPAGQPTGPSLYEQQEARQPPLNVLIGRRPARFAEALLEEVDKDELVSGARLVDEVHGSDVDNDVDFGYLIAFPDESLLFVGSDPTTRDTAPHFGFIVERNQPMPAPTSCQEALDLLRPGDVRRAFEEYDPPQRQGEWWLLPTRKVPVGSTWNPGLQSRPFGPSPLGNHVPTEYGFGVRDDVFMERFEEIAPEAPPSVASPPEVMDWLYRQRLFDDAPDVEIPDHVPDWDDIQAAAGEIYVRGTLRHRENDHFMEKIGEQWHEAQTHDVDVWTADDVDADLRIRID